MVSNIIIIIIIIIINIIIINIYILVGSSNAYTDAEDTVYYFDVNSDYLDEALDRYFYNDDDYYYYP